MHTRTGTALPRAPSGDEDEDVLLRSEDKNVLLSS